MPKISIIEHDVEYKSFFKRRIYNWIKKVIFLHQKQLGELTIILCSDEYLLEMNKNHLNHDYYTDIITFDLSESEDEISGELYISLDRVKENAGHFRTAIEKELYRVMIHGVLHLLGFKDKTEEEEQLMRSKENEMMKYL